MDEIAQEVERPSATEAQRGADALDQKLAGWRTADPCRVASQNIMWYTHTRCAHSPQTVGGSTCSAVIRPSVTNAHSSIHAHRVAGVTAESERGSAEVRCHGMQSMSGTTAIVSVTSRSGPHAMIIASTGSSRKGGSADDARPALYCGHSHPVMVDWHAPPRSHSHGVTAHSSCGSAPSAQSCAHEALADEVAAPIVRRRRDLLKSSQVKSKAPKLCELCPVKGTRLASY